MRTPIAVLCGLLLVSGCSQTASEKAKAQEAAPPQARADEPQNPPEETKDRLNLDAFKLLLASPLAAATAGDTATADREMTVILADTDAKAGPHSLRHADILSAFGVELYKADHENAALPYLERAVDAYRQALGPDSPEVAVALHDVANLRLDLQPDAAPPELIATVREALRIRRLKLGENNAETAVTYVLLGRILGFPQATKDDSASVDEAALQVRQGLDRLLRIPGAEAGDIDTARYRLAEVYAHNGRGAQTLIAVQDYWKAVDRKQADDVTRFKDRVGKLADLLKAHGEPTAAAQLKAAYPSVPNPAK
jgi:tetratricopeptide (TPR) repeat protein